jgi:hypothetical protein
MWVLFIVATSLRGTLRSRRPAFWFAVLLTWIAGSVAGNFGSDYLPFWLAALCCGIVTILTAVDTIYASSPQQGSVRTRVLLFAGLLAFAIVFGLQRPMPEIHTGWKIAPLPLALVMPFIVRGMMRMAGRAGERRAEVISQIASFAVCGAAVWLMLRLLEVLP